MAQSAGWDAVYAQTQTGSDDWTPITSGNTNGMTLGSSGNTTYYYVKGSYNFGSATNYGVSGLKIQGTVYLYIPYGSTINCVGGHANGATGAGAGIELAAGTPTNTLYIIGGGTVTATGGNAANGGNGADGTDADYSYNSWTRTGAGGKGGDGGGGAGAGVGTRGGNGGTGGAGGEGKEYNNWHQNPGTDGSNGGNGATAGAMGTLYVANDITLNATGGSKGTSGGAGGSFGKSAVDDDVSWNYTMAGGGGGGGGAYGGAAANIGTGGPGGGGGGGGAGGAMEGDDYNLTTVYAPGGYGAYNLDGSRAGNGNDSYCNEWAMNNGYVKQNSGFEGEDFTETGDVAMGSAGSYGSNGSAASAGTSNTGNLTYNITYNPVRTNINGKTGSTLNPLNVTYSPSAATDIVLPKNADGFQWVLSTYGKSCAPNGTTDSEFASATKEYYGGNLATTTERTIVLGHVYGDLVFQELPTRLNMLNSGSNEQELTEYLTVGYPITVRLEDRTIYRDNHWNTICLPFDMTKSQIATSPLKGATIYKLNESVTGYYPSGQVNKSPYQQYDYGYPVLLFWFDNVDVTASGTILQAGKPYLVKWAEPTEFTADGNYKDNTNDGNSRHELDFEGVTVTQTTGGSWTGAGTTNGNVIFQGTLSQSATLTAGDKTRLVLGVNDGKDKLYYPSKNMNVGACRGYFIIPEAAAAGAREMVMSFDEEGETTSISVPLNDHKQIITDDIFNLNGQRLNAPKKGVNIVNGKKVVIK